MDNPLGMSGQKVASLVLKGDDAAALAQFLQARPQNEVLVDFYADDPNRIEVRWGSDSPMYVAFSLDPPSAPAAP